MANTYGISERDERRIRTRDKHCVYCRVKFRKLPPRKSATIEHFKNNGPFRTYYNIAICCCGCNSSKSRKNLRRWLASPYCKRKGISETTVAKPVRDYLRRPARRFATRTSNQVMKPNPRAAH
jgi:hypothetical protein